MALTGPRLQVLGEPALGQPGDLLQRPGFLEQVRRACNDLQASLTAEFLHGLAVELDDHRVECSDDQQGGLADQTQVPVGEVGTASTADDRRHRARPGSGCYERGRGAGAGAEETDRDPGRGLMLGQPVCDGGYPARERLVPGLGANLVC